jgi:hypothetical protein
MQQPQQPLLQLHQQQQLQQQQLQQPQQQQQQYVHKPRFQLASEASARWFVEADIQQQERAAEGRPDDKYVPTVTRGRRITVRTLHNHDPRLALTST